jgi:hypothetical protein
LFGRYPGQDYRQNGKGKFQTAVEIGNPAPVISVTNESKAEDRSSSLSSRKSLSPSAPPIVDQLEPSSSNNNSFTPSIEQKSASMTDTMTFYADKARIQITEQMNILAESAKNKFNEIVINPIIEKAKRDALMQAYELRELFPRTGWHDAHASVNGLAARDIASHFVQVSSYHLL